jgi:hypothetical protein
LLLIYTVQHIFCLLRVSNVVAVPYNFLHVYNGIVN